MAGDSSLPLMPGSEEFPEPKFMPEPEPAPHFAYTVLDGIRNMLRQEMHPNPYDPRAMAGTPERRPAAHTGQRLQGRYDFSARSDQLVRSSLHGAVRWLDPDTGFVYDAQGQRQWTFRKDATGNWSDDTGTRFVLDPPDVPASINQLMW